MLRRSTLMTLLGWFGIMLLFISIPAMAHNSHRTVSQTFAESQVSLERPIFGVETNTGRIVNTTIKQRARQLGAAWLRLNTVSWRSVQPEADTPEEQWDWTALSVFETELTAAAQSNLTPMVIVDDSPRWATILPTSCGAIREDRFDDFARFMQALVTRYKQAPYNVHYWELGNEVDIDPDLVGVDNIFGCWGDIDDPLYGGQHYGNMLKVVYPAIKAADPDAQVLIGGLLLDRPDTRITGRGKPERFLEGILQAGAGSSFDIVAFHTYPWFNGAGVDSDLTDFRWAALGGMVFGKARFLREVMSRYGVDKPLFLNETALLGRSQTSVFFEGQAEHIVRTTVRSMAAGIQAYCWYTLHDSGWLSAGLLDKNGNPRLPFITYQTLIKQVGTARNLAATNAYTSSVEAYRIDQGSYLLDMLWSRSGQSVPVEIPRPAFLAAYTRSGATIIPRSTLTGMQIEVGQNLVYIHSLPVPSNVVPQVASVTPVQGSNESAVRLTIVGSNFVPGASVALNNLPLTAITFVDSTRLEATIPAGFPIGTYSLVVGTPDGWMGSLRDAFTMRTTSPPRISEVRPAYGRDVNPNTIHVYGANFSPGVTLTLGTRALPPVQYVDSSHIIVDIPRSQFTSGRYDLRVVNPDMSTDTLEGAYTFYTASSSSTIDLQGYPYELWTNPATLHAGMQAVVGQVVHNSARLQSKVDTLVMFYLLNQESNESDIFLGSTTVTIPAGAHFATANVTFTVPVSGVYTLQARIDPNNAVTEVNKENNVVGRTLTVLPAPQSSITPTISSFRINGGATTTTNPDVLLTVSAPDSWPGIGSVFFVEYEYNLGALQWIPVQQSRTWEPMRPGQAFSWQLVPTPGLKYVRAWIANNAGAITEAAQAAINYIPTEAQVQQTHSDIYRYTLSSRDQLTIDLEIPDGVLDLYVWSSSSQLLQSQRVSETQQVSLVVPGSGVRQIEVDSVISATYRLNVTRGSRSEVISQTIDGAIPMDRVSATVSADTPSRTRSLVGLDSRPTGRFALPEAPLLTMQAKVYLPVVPR